MSQSWRGYTRNPDGSLTRVIEVHEPGHAVLYRGSLYGTKVTGAPGPTENERKRKRVREREAANAAQRAYYARKTGTA